MTSDPHREEDCPIPVLPLELADVLTDSTWTRNAVGESGSHVYRLRLPDLGSAPGRTLDRYLKHGREAYADDVADEAARLRWLAGRVTVPAISGYVRHGDDAWLLTEALPGQTAYQVLTALSNAARIAVVDSLAGFLRRFHALPAMDCPFDSSNPRRLALARARLNAGLVDEGDFDDARAGLTAQEVWDQMTACLPLATETVVTHGDYSLDNILMMDGAVVGCIDVGRAGVADPYQDLAILWNCLGEFDPALQKRLFGSYGIGEPDERRLHFHLLLDEFF